jgi:hypothetical protein
MSFGDPFSAIPLVLAQIPTQHVLPPVAFLGFEQCNVDLLAQGLFSRSPMA